MEENMNEICRITGELIKLTRAGSGIDKITYDEQSGHALIHYSSGLVERANIVGDSGSAAVMDIVKKIRRD